MSARPDPVDEALALLRDEPALPLPDPAFERRLREGPRRLPRARRSRRVAALLGASLLGGASLVAHASWTPVRDWIVHVEHGDQRLRQDLAPDEEARFDFVTDEGRELQLRLRRDVDEHGRELRELAIDERGDGVLREERLRLGEPDLGTRRPRSELDGLEPLARLLGSDGIERAVYLKAEPGAGTAVLVAERRDGAPVAVRAIGRAERRPDELVEHEWLRTPQGTELVLRGEPDWEYAVRIPDGTPARSEYRDPGTSLRVRWKE